MSYDAQTEKLKAKSLSWARIAAVASVFCKGAVQFLWLLSVLWTVGFLGRLLVWAAERVGLLVVKGHDGKKFASSKKQGVIVYHRHPSLKEAAILPFLLLTPRHPFDVLKIPISVPDKYNFYDRWWFAFVRIACIPVDRSTRMGRGRALLQITRVLGQGGIVILAPEGGRTYNGKEFKVLAQDGSIAVIPLANVPKNSKGRVDDSKPVIRRFQFGFQRAALQASVLIPAWVDTSGWPIKIIFGQPVEVSSLPEDKILLALEDALLKLAAEE